MTAGSAELLVNLLRVDYVITMRAAGSCLQVRGAIEMADAKFSQVIGDHGGIGEAEAAM